MTVNPMTPLSKLYVLASIPFDSMYKDVMDFTSKANQFAFFNSKARYKFDDLTPIRMQNKIRLPRPADDVYDCNYIMYQNANFGSKWFYCFISSIDYINPNMCEVSVALDAWQTWQFDVTLKQSFIVREHVMIDDIGRNLIPEDLELGDYVTNDLNHVAKLQDMSIVIASTVNEDAEFTTGGMYGGVYSGLNFFSATVDNYIAIDAYIQRLTDLNKNGSIVSMFMMPTVFVTSKNDFTPESFEFNIGKDYHNSFGGYVPKNNKLYTYPYNFLYVTNLCGNSANFAYEYFSNALCQFKITGDMSCNPQVLMIPLNYKGASFNINEQMVLDGYPQCAWVVDTFKAWLAQNAASLPVSMLSSSIGGFGAAISGNTMGAVNGVMGVAGIMAKVHDTYTLPPQAKGSAGSSTAVALRQKSFIYSNMRIRNEYAEIIDEYFSSYGYASHEIKTPYIRGRKCWNYVKTIDVKMIGNVPFDDIDIIKDMFNNGVTFWHDADIGNYQRDNSPV